MKRDPQDRRYGERLVGSSLASILLHVLAAALLFAVVANSSEEGATESVSGGEVVTLDRRPPTIAQPQPAAPQVTAPQPFVPRIAPPRHPAPTQPAHQLQRPNRHELAKIVPHAPPNPSPIPQASLQPAPQPTQAVVELRPENDVAAAPISVPTAPTIAVVPKDLPRAIASPVPTSVPSARPVQRPPAPTAAPSAKPTAAPVARPSAAPTTAAVLAAAKASAAPTTSPAPGPAKSAPPAQHSGVPSPSPTSGAAPAKTVGVASSPGPKGQSSPGPRPGNAPRAKPGPSKPVTLPPTPAPSHPGITGHGQPARDINARLRGLLGGTPVTPQMKQYTPGISLRGHLEPTPPPAILAQTKYLFEEKGSGNEARIKMWVTGVRHVGPLTLCVGWLVRYPEAIRQNNPMLGPAPGVARSGAANGTQISIGGGAVSPVSPFGNAPSPIVEENATTTCSARRLTPYSAASPSP